MFKAIKAYFVEKFTGQGIAALVGFAVAALVL